MQIQCPRCQTKYNLDESLLSPEGSQVRCSRCGHEFEAKPGSAPETAPARVPRPPKEDMSDDLMEFLEEDGPIAGLDLEDEKPSKGSGSKKILAYLLILILLLALLLGGVLFMKTRGVHLDTAVGVDLYKLLPFLGPKQPEAEKSQPGGEASQDPGNKRIQLAGVNGSFLELEESGQVFVIKGQVKNTYDHPVKEIKLRGILHTKEKRNAAESIVFAGHDLGNEELQSLARSVIEEILTNPQVAEGTEAGVKSGEAVNFMIVFFDLPENLLEYTVEVVSSRSASK